MTRWSCTRLKAKPQGGGAQKGSDPLPREDLLDPFNKIYGHLRKFGLLIHVGLEGKKIKTEAMFCPARDKQFEDGGTSDLVLDCGVTIGLTESFVYLGSTLHRDLSDHRDVDYRIK